jgi:chromosome segregation ATPase
LKLFKRIICIYNKVMSEEATVGKELIAGMEQVILHIQHQESSIQELKKTFEQTQEKAVEIDTKNKELETANKFLSNIVEAQTKKIEQLANQLRLERFTKDNDVQIKKIVELEEENKELKETCDSLDNSGMKTAHEYEVLSEKMANDSETFVGVISDLESQVKSLESENNNLKCVLNHEGIDKPKCKQILKILADDCQPDGWDSM